MAENTARLVLPYIRASQSQKEVTHNGALNMLDALVQPVAEASDLTAPPASPAEGQMWIVAASATGDWAGHDGKLAHFVGGAWAYYAPAEGWRVWIRAEEAEARFDGTAWAVGEVRAAAVLVDGMQVLGAQAAAIADATSGATVDAEARAALNALLAACRAHGLIGS